MYSLPSIDYSPLTTDFIPVNPVREELGIKTNWLPDSEYVGNYPPFSLSEKEIMCAARLYQFALHNNFGFIGNLSGTLPFPRSYFRSVVTRIYPIMLTYAFIAQIEGGWLEIGQLRQDTATTYEPYGTYYIYVKGTLSQNYPDITIDSRSSGLPTSSRGKPLYMTESSEFDRLFKLYLNKDYAIEGLKVLSPDVMSILIDHFSQFDIEMRGHTISFITRGHDLTDPETLKDIIESTGILIQELSYQIRQPADPTGIPQDMTSYKEVYGYTRVSEKIVNARAKRETWIVFLTSVTFALLLFVIALLSTLL